MDNQFGTNDFWFQALTQNLPADFGYFLKIICGYLFLSSRGDNIPDVTIISQYLNSNKFNMTCITNGDSPAIVWNEPIPEYQQDGTYGVSEFIPPRNSPYNCKINVEGDFCNRYWAGVGTWTIRRSVQTTLRPVTDYRWEGFELIHTDGTSTDKQIAFLNANQFKIHISIRADSPYIYLCTGSYRAGSNCYLIILSSVSSIRQCIPRKPCNSDAALATSETPVVNSQAWNHFTIEKNGKTLTVSKGQQTQPLLIFNNWPNWQTPYLLVNTYGTPGYWKLHNYAFTATDRYSTTEIGETMNITTYNFCMAMFVAMCGQCTLEIEVFFRDAFGANDVQTIWTDEIVPKKAMTWQQQKINATLPSVPGFVQLRVRSLCPRRKCKYPYWAIDNVQLCSEGEIRVLNKDLDATKASCQVITNEDRGISQTAVQTGIKSDSQCSPETFGRDCTKCNTILGLHKPYCDASIICEMSNERSVCRCATGYDPPYCRDKCPYNKYGNDCSLDCGHCGFPPCNAVTGECPGEDCLYPFMGRQCQQSVLPVLLNPPEIIETSYTSVSVKIRNSSYEGKMIPLHYKIQYAVSNAQGQKEANDLEWKETDPELFQEEYLPIKLEGLDILTTYIIQAILITDTNTFYNGVKVPKVNATTTCKALEKNDVNYKTYNTSVVFKIEISMESCKIEHYAFKLNNEPLQPMFFNFNATDLQPFTDYELVITNLLYRKSIDIKLKTEEGAPSIIPQVRVPATNATSISITWQPPEYKNGHIRHYRVKYTHARYLGCEDGKGSNLEKVLIETGTSTLITDLLPYSQYLIEITAVTVIDGIPYQLYSNTTESESLDASEIPAITNLQSGSSNVKVTLRVSDCKLIKGSAVYYVSWRCSNEWCLESLSTKNVSDIRQPIHIQNLSPYSNYTVKIELGRKQGDILKGTNIIKSFITDVSAPHIITKLTDYSRTNSTISLRLLPPYPPTGELEMYSVEYCYYYSWTFSTYKTCYDKTFEPEGCKFWPTLHCLLLKGLLEDTDYELKVTAKNKNTVYNQPTPLRVRTVQAPPDILENFTCKWDDYYNLTLTWDHPSKTNGPLTKFTVRIESESNICNKSSFPINENTYNITYNYVIPLKTCYASKLTITAAAVNINEGAPKQFIIDSPPKSPSFSEEPSIKTVTNSTMDISLPTLKDFEENSVMFIIITTTSYKPQSTTDLDELPDIAKKLELPVHSFSWIVAEFDKAFDKKQFTLGNNMTLTSKRLKRELYNPELRSNMIYTISTVLTNEYEGLKRYSIYKREASTSEGIPIEENDQDELSISSSSNNGLFALVLLLVIPIILYFVLRKKDFKNKFNFRRFPVVAPNTNLGGNASPDVIPLTTNKESKPNTSTHVLIKPKQSLPANGENPNKQQPTTSTKQSSVKLNEEKINKFSKPVKITDFENYVKASIENGELERQHQLFPRGQTKPWDYGLLPQNKSKNRYNNLVAYDHTRVKLAKINNDPYSDYINANYVEGYNTKKAYIATQGPKIATVNDFWRMIWQENVNYIVMLANVVEGGKKKSEQYWPNVNESLEFGEIKVTYYSSRVFADYEYRTFTVTSDNVERTIEQLHFTSWPDHGVPLYSQSLVPFLRKLLTIPQGTSPIVVHCSAGVGRTGTIILCDLCLRMAAREGVVDVLKHQHNLREQRANLVDNIEQYKLAHLVLLECLIALHTSITCDEKAESTILQLISSEKPQQQLQYINDTAWQDQAMRPPMEVTFEPEWASKNRFQDIIPSGYGRVYISRFPVNDEHSDYINAVEADGFRCPQQFIVTQQPLKNTVPEFWRMVHEKEVTTIVSLNKINLSDETSCIFWPTAKVSELRPVPYLTLQFHNRLDNDDYSTTIIHMYNTKDKQNEKRVVNLIILKGWLPNKLVPDSEESLLKLWAETERLGRGDSPIIVTCYDGAKASGLFIALIFVIEKLKLEQECDVCLAVRTVRRNRKQFVIEMEQLVFLYRASISYLRTFDIYSNFSTTGK